MKKTAKDNNDTLNTAFGRRMVHMFGKTSAKKVLRAFENLSLPVPEARDEYLEGTEGALVFSNKYGVVLRIERAMNEKHSGHKWDRVDNNPWVQKPLASIKAGDAVIEVCAGGGLVDDPMQAAIVERILMDSDVNFWDSNEANLGAIPFKTPLFPKGVPIVIDRTAVRKLTEGIEPFVTSLNMMQVRAAEKLIRKAEKEIYQPLRRAFREAKKDKNMQAFWDKCAAAKKKGDLCAGWNQKAKKGADLSHKTVLARKHARAYDKKIAKSKKAGPKGLGA
ncbi:MAG: hypothetical protein OXT65_03485 [Alphaproteobacteria bacterium]|nr:hypothetical protein [Alphaproteobacteria bacterium]